MRILWLKSDLLHPPDRGGRIRTLQMLRQLRRDHEITYLCLDDGHRAADALERAVEYAQHVECIPFAPPERSSARFFLDLARNALSPMPYAIGKYASPAMERRVRQLVAAGGVDVLVSDFLMPSQNVPDNLPCPTVLFQHNVEAQIWQRHTTVSTGAARQLYFRSQWRRMQRYEGATCRRFDHVIAVSEADAALLQREYAPISVSWVPTGVDTEFFTPRPPADAQPNELVFLGALDWMPNEDAVEHFVRDVLPFVRARRPEATFTVVGRKPTRRVMRALEGVPGVRLIPDVPDVRPYLSRAAVFVVPIRIGGGTRLKLYEALAMGLPVVSTRVGAEGLPLEHGTHLCLADSATDQATAIANLLEAPAAAGRMGAAGAAYVREEFGWDHVGQLFAAQCREVVARVNPRRSSAA